MGNGRRTLAAIVVGAVTLSAVAQTQRPAQDEGAAGAWQKLLKLQTTASAMHTTAHPDDEHGGVLAMLSRGQGARVSMLTLNRGESGDNAIGSELFDAVGLLRTEELLIADRYYGVDRQYFTTMIDYGFSKRLDETLGKWGRDNVLRDVVRVIRTERPFVLISRFQGNERDGHGNHQAAGLVTVEAFKAAGDAAMFPEQIAAGLRPWQPLKLYMGGVRENEDWTLRVDTGVYDPVLGESYQTFSRLGLSFQRSQNGGLFSAQPGPSVSYYKRLQSIVDAPAKESSFFDGIDTTIPGIYKALRKTAPAGAEAALQAIDREIKSAIQSFKMVEPSASTPALARALAATHAAQRQLGGDPDVASLLARKEQQLQAALRATLGVSFTALAQPAGTEEPTGPFAAFARPPAMPPVVPGQAFEVKTTFTNRSPIELKALRVKLEGHGTWAAQPETSGTGRRQQRPGVVHIHAHDSGGRRPDTALFLAEVDSGSPVHDVGRVAILAAQRRAAARCGRDFRRQRRAHGDPRAGHTSGCEPSVRLRDARARHRASDRSHHAPEPGGGAARSGGEERSSTDRSVEQQGRQE